MPKGRAAEQYSDGVVGHALHDTEVIAEVEVAHGFTKKAKKVETGSVWTDSTRVSSFARLKLQM